jgi:hypothetical protein
MDTAEQVIEVFSKMFAMYALLLVVFGTIGNIFACFVCLSRSLRTRTTFKFLAIMSISDTVALFQWNLKHFVFFFFDGYDWDKNFLVACRLDQFLQMTSLQFSAWILVRLLLDIINLIFETCHRNRQCNYKID